MTFKHERVGTRFFAFITDDKHVHLKNKPEKGSILTEVRKVPPRGAYINMRPIVGDRSLYFSVFRTDDGYELIPATDGEIKEHARSRVISSESGKLGQNCTYITLTAKDAQKLRSKKYMKISVYNNDPELYMEVRPTDEKLPSMREALKKQGLCITKQRLAKEITYGIKGKLDLQECTYANSLFIPAVVRKYAKTKQVDRLHCWWRDDGSFIIEAEPKTCEVCGKPVRRYGKHGATVNICRACANTIPVMGKLIKAAKKTTDRKGAYTRIRAELGNLKTVLEEMKKDITR